MAWSKQRALSGFPYLRVLFYLGRCCCLLHLFLLDICAARPRVRVMVLTASISVDELKGVRCSSCEVVRNCLISAIRSVILILGSQPALGRRHNGHSRMVKCTWRLRKIESHRTYEPGRVHNNIGYDELGPYSWAQLVDVRLVRARYRSGTSSRGTGNKDDSWRQLGLLVNLRMCGPRSSSVGDMIQRAGLDRFEHTDELLHSGRESWRLSSLPVCSFPDGEPVWSPRLTANLGRPIESDGRGWQDLEDGTSSSC